MMALGASASQCCKRSRPRLARSNSAGGMAVASSRQRYRPPPADLVFSPSSADLLRRPPEARAVAPRAMQDDRQLGRATFALVAPLRLAKRMPHALNVDHVDTRVSSTLAASNR